jgi:hypothetical protein
LGGCNAYDAEGHAEKLLNRAQTKIEKKAGLSGDGLYQTGNGMIMTGNGMFQAGRGSTFVTQPLMTTGHSQGLHDGRAGHDCTAPFEGTPWRTIVV